MSDPVVVLDENDVVVDYNRAAEALFDGENGDEEVRGEPLESVISGLLDAIRAEDVFVALPGDVRTDGGTRRVYDPECTSFHDHHDILRGRLVVLRDITIQKRREETLEALQSATRQFIEAEDAVSIADIAVATADEVLEYPYAGVMFYDSDDDVLSSAVSSDALETHADRGFVVPRCSSVVWDVFDSSESRVYESGDADFDLYIDLPVEKLLVLPLGDHGVFGVGSPDDHDGYTDADDIRFVTLLSIATETALDWLEGERELRES
ncbi:GAF domain-containing protein [Haladaptatus sp. NG-WS-4]